MPDFKQGSSFKTQRKSHCHRKKKISKENSRTRYIIRESTQLIHQLYKVSLQF